MPAEVKWLALVLVLAGFVGGAFAVSFGEAKAAFGRQDWKAASALFGEFLKDHPDDPDAVTASFLRAVALFQLGDYRGSLDGFQKLDRAWPQSPFAKQMPYWRGTAALAAGQYALAERELAGQARYPDEKPYAVRAILNLALARLGQGQDGPAVQALDAFTKASQEAGLLAQAWSVWGDLDRKQGRSTESLRHYQAAWESNPGGPWDIRSRTQALELLVSLDRWDEAAGLADTSSQKFPAEIRWDRLRVAILQGRNDKAGLARLLDSLWSRETDPGRKQDAATDRAKVAEDLGKPDPAWWLKASVGPDVSLGASAIQRYAFLLEGGNRWAEAAAALERWAADHPADAVREDVRSRAALDQAKAGDGKSARKNWDQLLAEFPRSARVSGWLLGRGRSFLEAGDTEKALPDLSRILRDSPKSAEAPEARYQTGLVYLKRQEPVRAESWFYGLVQDLKSGDLYERALLARGVAFVNSGQPDLARSSLERLLREDPQGPWSASAWMALGRNALQNRLFDEAATAFGKAEAVQKEPADKAKARWSLAEALTGLGKLDEAAESYRIYTSSYSEQPQAQEARYRRGLVWFTAKNWDQAAKTWTAELGAAQGKPLAEIRAGLAEALLRLGRPEEGWAQLDALEASDPSPEAWYRWGQAATALGQTDWAVKAFQTLIQKHPTSGVAQAALPRAAGALLTGGRPDEALNRYADYFRKFGGKPESAPVARAAAAAAVPYPKTLEALVAASRTWGLSPEVAAEFSLAWAQSRLDSDSEKAQAELRELSQTAPWTSQRSEALVILGRWQTGKGQLAEARRVLEAAAAQGDDLSVFKARWALAQLTDAEGDVVSGARQREICEKAAGPGVPLEFRLSLLKEASAAWTKAGRPDDAKRVEARIAALGS